MIPDNIVFVKVGKLYNNNHVYQLKNNLLDFYPDSNYWCYTDSHIDDINIIPPIITLKKWWPKLALFSNSMPFEGTVLYFDLDSVVKRKIEINHYKGLTVLNAYWKGNAEYPPHSYNVNINSSIMKWTAGKQDHIWKHFLSNKDYFMRKYVGIDRFLVHEKIKLEKFPEGIVNTMQLNDREACVDIYNGLKYEL